MQDRSNQSSKLDINITIYFVTKIIVDLLSTMLFSRLELTSFRSTYDELKKVIFTYLGYV